jgi:hypothetical protein
VEVEGLAGGRRPQAGDDLQLLLEAGELLLGERDAVGLVLLLEPAGAEEAGRKGDDLTYSNALVVCVGRDEAEVARRAAAIGREVDELKLNGLAGSPAEVVDKIGRYAEAGASRVYLQVLDLDDLDHLELISSQVQSQLS